MAWEGHHKFGLLWCGGNGNWRIVTERNLAVSSKFCDNVWFSLLKVCDDVGRELFVFVWAKIAFFRIRKKWGSFEEFLQNTSALRWPKRCMHALQETGCQCGVVGRLPMKRHRVSWWCFLPPTTTRHPMSPVWWLTLRCIPKLARQFQLRAQKWHHFEKWWVQITQSYSLVAAVSPRTNHFSKKPFVEMKGLQNPNLIKIVDPLPAFTPTMDISSGDVLW